MCRCVSVDCECDSALWYWQSLQTAVFRSHPESVSGPEVPPALTLFGAPCDASPALSSAELALAYRGCQNVPLAVWFGGRTVQPAVSSLERLVQETGSRRRR